MTSLYPFVEKRDRACCVLSHVPSCRAIFQVGVIQLEAAFQCPVRDTLLTLEYIEDLGKNVIEGHKYPSAAWGFPSLCTPKMTHFRQEGKGGLAGQVRERRHGRAQGTWGDCGQ